MMILQFAFHIIILVIYPLAYAQEDNGIIIAQPGCNSTCGNVTIPFPFGMKDLKCYIDKVFEIECRRNTSQGVHKPYLKSLNLEVRSIDAGQSTVVIMNPIHRSNNCESKSNNSNRIINLQGSPFVYSQEWNSFLSVGCNNHAFLQPNGTKVGGCISVCDDDDNNNNDNFDGCHGRYCCDTSLPMNLSEYNVTLENLGEQSVGSQSSHSASACGYSLIVSSSWISLRDSYFNDLKNMEYAPAVLEWEILNHMLINSTMQLPSDSVCYNSSITSSSNRTTGRRCSCSSDYRYGNPYVAGGCPAQNPNDYYYYKNNRAKKSAIVGALFYLHSIASQPIYHRDVKTTNILLDEKYRAKLADFGASRIISIEATHLTTVVQGTFGYLDPEYFHTSQFTEKSDVYSFGVVLAELLTCQKPITSAGPGEYQNLASYFVHCMEENILFDIIDKRLTKEGDKEHIITVANLAKRCLELNGRKRPTMKEVMLELEGIRGSNMNSNAELNNEEIELVGIEEFPPWAGYSASNSMPILSNLTHSSDSEVMHILATK